MSATKNLAEYIEEELVMTSWYEYQGISEPSLPQLYALLGFVNAAIQEKQAVGGKTE